MHTPSVLGGSNPTLPPSHTGFATFYFTTHTVCKVPCVHKGFLLETSGVLVRQMPRSCRLISHYSFVNEQLHLLERMSVGSLNM